MMDATFTTAGGTPVAVRGDLEGPGRALLFIPGSVDYFRIWLRQPVFNCPTVAVQTNSLEASLCEPETAVRALLQLLPSDNGPSIIFGYSSGSIMASQVASVLAISGHTVKLLLVNPLVQWWPLPGQAGDYEAIYNTLNARAATDPALLARLNARGEILSHLGAAMQHNLRVKIFVSSLNPGDVRAAERIAAVTGAAVVPIQTDAHHVIWWFHRQVHEGPHLKSSLYEQIRRKWPDMDPAKIEAGAQTAEASMREFWARTPDLQTIADTL